MGLSVNAKAKYFGHNLLKIKSHEFSELEFDLNRNYVTEFLVKSIVWAKFDKVRKPIVFYILRRIQQIVPLYIESRNSFINFVDSGDYPIDLYLDALNKIEIIVTYLYQIYNVYINLSGIKLFIKNDGSFHDRLNRCYNNIKHLDLNNLPLGLLQSTYLESNKFCTSSSYVTFQELNDFIRELEQFADKLLKE